MRSGAAYRMLFGKQYTFDALRGLTVGLEWAAHIALPPVIRHWDIQLDAEKESDDCYRQMR